MTHSPSTLRVDDFRDAAAAASLAAIYALAGQSADPTQSGLSYCLLRPDNPAPIRRACKYHVVICLLLGFSCLGLSVMVIGNPVARHMPVDPLIIGLLFSFFGIGCFFAGAFLPRRLLRTHLQRTVGDFWADATLSPIHVNIENARTYQKLKLLPEDLGILLLHPATHCVQIEALSYRYLIYAADVTRLERFKTREQEAVFLSYRIGSEILELAIIPDSLNAAFKRKLLIGDSGLFARLQIVLCPRIAAS